MIRETPFPTIPQMEQMGLVKCTADPRCRTWVEPVNSGSRERHETRCAAHRREQARKTRTERRDRDEQRYAPRPDRQRRPRA